MATYSVREAKTHLSRLLVRAEFGEEIVIARRGRPIAVLKALVAPERRRPGGDRVVIHDDFDDPVSDLTQVATGNPIMGRSDVETIW